MIRPDGKDPRTLRLFFAENTYLTTSELARLIGVSMETIRAWRKKSGVPMKPSWGLGRAPKQRPAVFEIMVPRAIWDTKKWLEAKYCGENKGIALISRMTGSNHKLVWQRLKFHGIEIRSHERATCSHNPCCNKKWLVDNYEIEGLPLRKCAALAQVSTYTIYRWLVKFNVHIRDIREAEMGYRNHRYGKIAS